MHFSEVNEVTKSIHEHLVSFHLDKYSHWIPIRILGEWDGSTGAGGPYTFWQAYIKDATPFRFQQIWQRTKNVSHHTPSRTDIAGSKKSWRKDILKQTIPSTVMLDSSCGQLYASCSPPNSVDLDLLLLDALGLPSLLSESLTLESLSGELDTPIPDFSFAYRPPPLEVVDLGERLQMWPPGWFRKPITTGSERTGKVVLAAPTAPRLQSMLRENISISRWLKPVTLLAQPDPRDIPWNLDSIVSNNKLKVWKPEGSIFSPEAKRAAMAGRRRGLSCRLDSPQNRQFFQREVALKTDGTVKNVRFRIPVDTMHPETVKILLELQSLNSFYKDGLDEADDSSNNVPEQANKPPIPSIMVSNSRFAFPLSLESSDALGCELPPSLAARRGRRSLPPLITTVNCEIASLPYPSIPTAFLGSPSSYSPTFDPAAFDDSIATEDLSIGVQDMIVSLRSQCATLGPASPSSTELSRALSELNQSPASCHESSDSDEWAFAESLLEGFGSRLPHVTPPKTPSVETTSLPHTKPQSAETVSDPIFSTRKYRVPRRNKTTSGKESILPAKQPNPPTTPSPPLRPALASPPSQGSTDKAKKTVRFASLPARRPCSGPLPTPTVRPQPLANALSRPPQSVAEKALEDNIGNDDSGSPSNPSSNLTSETLWHSMVVPRPKTRSVHSSSIAPLSPHDTNAALSRKVSSDTVGYRHLSGIGKPPVAEKKKILRGKEALTPSLGNPTSPPFTPKKSMLQEKASAPWSPHSFIRHSFGRHSLSRIMKSPTVGKENEEEGADGKYKRKTYSNASPSVYAPASPLSGRNVNENAARRGSGSVAKSRMPTPLRKIFRFS